MNYINNIQEQINNKKIKDTKFENYKDTIVRKIILKKLLKENLNLQWPTNHIMHIKKFKDNQEILGIPHHNNWKTNRQEWTENYV